MSQPGSLLLVALLTVLLAGCGMKGDLYEPPPSGGASSAGTPTTETDDAGKGERKTIPTSPDPAQAR